MENKKPIVLMILDGFGIRKETEFNGILESHMANYFSYWNNYPHTKLNASGPLVGLPKGQIGSSEVGHLTIGAGRLIEQELVTINKQIKGGDFLKNKVLNSGLDFIEKSNGNIHIMGLLSCGGVHSLEKHLFSFLNYYDNNIEKIKGKVFIHCITDGRDTAQKSALIYLNKLNKFCQKLKNKNKFVISTICGRFYAMDRDKKWKRTKIAIDMLISGKGEKYNNFKQVIEKSYENEIYDEFIKPSILEFVPLKKGDLFVFYNFRTDRPKQIIEKLISTNLQNFKIQTLVNYSPLFDVDVMYQTPMPKNTLGEIISKKGLRQLRIAESEKFPHITYYFNGLNYTQFKGEDRIKILSPKVETYDLKPEMSCKEVTKKLIKEIKSKKYDFILVNFANPDMVGHTGNFKAVKQSLNFLDNKIKEVKDAIDEEEGVLLITADHGNCEEMKDEEGNPNTKHTTNLVPFIVCNNSYNLYKDKDLSLYNIAPTILELMKIKKFEDMEKSLLRNRN